MPVVRVCVVDVGQREGGQGAGVIEKGRDGCRSVCGYHGFEWGEGFFGFIGKGGEYM